MIPPFPINLKDGEQVFDEKFPVNRRMLSESDDIPLQSGCGRIPDPNLWAPKPS
jgi:hypothetical protein